MSEDQGNIDHVATRLTELMNEWWLQWKVFVEPHPEGHASFQVVSVNRDGEAGRRRTLVWNGREEEWRVISE